MEKSEFEVCGIRKATAFKRALLGPTVAGYYYVAEVVTNSGTTVIGKSEQFPDILMSRSDLEEEQVNSRASFCYHQLLHQLVNDGWEPISSTETGFVQSLRRRKKRDASLSTSHVNEDMKEEATISGEDLLNRLERLSELRKQGLLTDEEFRAAKAKLLA